MSTTSQYTSFSDLYLGLEQAVRVTTGITATENLAKRAINVALQDMHLGMEYRYPWAERRAVLRTQDDYSTGTITATQGSTAVTGASTLWKTANSFAIDNVRTTGKILIGGGTTPYGISSVTNDTAAVLTDRFVETTVSAGTYVYYEDEYDLATDFLRPVDAQRFSDEVNIDIISRTEFRRRYPSNTTRGRPTVATILDFAPSGNTTPIRRVKFSPAPDSFILIPYTYITSNLVVDSTGTAKTGFTADSDEPIVPLRYRHAILFHALYNWYRDRKDDDRAIAAKAEYTDIMMRIMSDSEIGAVRPQIRPRISGYVRAAKSPYSGGSGRFDINGKFDRMG